MKNIIAGLNKIFDHRIRLGIMAVLAVNDSLSFNELKELLDITDGNLATHLKALDSNGMIGVHKRFIGKKTNTSYSITKSGEKQFREHLKALEGLMNV